MRFETTLSQFGDNTGIEVPPVVLEELGGGNRPAVAVTVNGYSFTSTVGTMAGKRLVPFNAARRRESGISGGDAIVVEIELDTAPRVVEPTPDLAEALAADPAAAAAWEKLAPSYRKAHVTAIESAKQPETRAGRVAKVVETLAGS